MRFAKWVFYAAGVYGIVAIAPQYFTERQVARDYPPAVTHPEYYYGFLGVCLAFQVLFLLIGADPVSLRAAMLAGVLEKVSFAVAVPVLYALHRVPGLIVTFSMIDLAWAASFVVAYLRTPGRPRAIDRPL